MSLPISMYGVPPTEPWDVSPDAALAAILALCSGESPAELPEHPAVAAVERLCDRYDSASQLAGVADGLMVKVNLMAEERDAARARVAELEASRAEHCKAVDDYAARALAAESALAAENAEQDGVRVLLEELGCAAYDDSGKPIADADRIRKLLAAERAAHEATRVALRLVLPYIEELSEQYGQGYGYFPGGDPRTFKPDAESCTPLEIAAHRDACAAWDRGERRPMAPTHQAVTSREEAEAALGAGASSALLTTNAGGEVVGHVTEPEFGIGTYTMVDEDLDAAIAAARKALEGK